MAITERAQHHRWQAALPSIAARRPLLATFVLIAMLLCSGIFACGVLSDHGHALPHKAPGSSATAVMDGHHGSLDSTCDHLSGATTCARDLVTVSMLLLVAVVAFSTHHRLRTVQLMISREWRDPDPPLLSELCVLRI